MSAPDASKPTGQAAGEDSPDRKITIVGTVSGGVRGDTRDVVERTIDVSQVKRGFENFLENLRAIIAVDVPSVGAFELAEVQFSAEISANGDFKLLGTGVGIEARSGVTFTLKRRST